MAQRKPDEKATLHQVLELADQLSPEEQEQLVEEMKLHWLRRAVDEGEQSSRLHGTRPVEEVMAELNDHALARLKESQQ
jgi:hypothetical protein